MLRAMAEVEPAQDPERTLILTYAPTGARAALAALLALDNALSRLLRTTREPALGQIRLAWWRERLEALDGAPPPAEPVLAALAADVLHHGVTGASLVPIVHGWEVLIEAEALTTDAMEAYGSGRGTLFVRAGEVLGAKGDPLAGAGAGWALADLSRRSSDPAEAAAARMLAEPLLGAAAAQRWSRAGRPLGALAHLARMDLALPPHVPPPLGAPRRVGRLFWHRLTGR